MRPTASLKWVILLSIALQQTALAQSVKKFTYEGSGDRNSGHVNVEYLLESGGKPQKFQGSVIDLNNYAGSVKFIVRFSDLTVGLNRKGTKTRNSNHYMRYYLRITHQRSGRLTPLGNHTLEIGAEGGSLRKQSDQITYRVRSVTAQSTATLHIQVEVIDAADGESWKTKSITRKITLLPRISDIEVSAWRPVAQLWEKIKKEPGLEDKKILWEKCLEYLGSCEEGTFSGRYEETALFYLINILGGEDRDKYIREYEEKYPKGQYREQIDDILKEEQEKETLIPVEPGARLDFDAEYLIIDHIHGGKKPYRLKFFKDKKRDSFPLHGSYAFSKSYDRVELAALSIPEGTYTVVIADSNGSEFVEEDGIYISDTLKIHPSIKLGGLLLVFGSMAFAYKKYIHF